MKTIDQATLDALAARASAATRGRAHLTLHASDDDPVQRFFIAADARSYFRPHRHLTRAELTFVVRGTFDLLEFDPAGRVLSRRTVSAAGPLLAIEVPPGTWHTLIACQDGAILLEIKQGPYDPQRSAEFAAWAPAEGEARVAAFQQQLRAAAPGDSLGG